MYAAPRTDSTISVSSSANVGGEVGGPISKVLILNGDATSALAALMGNLDAIFALPTDTGLAMASNHREALLDLRRSAFGY